MAITGLTDFFDGVKLQGYLDSTLTSDVTTDKHLVIRDFAESPFYPWSMADLNMYSIGYFEGMTMEELDQGYQLANREIWSELVAKSSAHRYSNMLTYTVVAASPTAITSSDQTPIDLLTDFQTIGEDYYIELVLRDFPAQLAAGYLDLTASELRFSSDGFGVETDEILFDESENVLSAGGDVVLRINRDLLVNTDLTRVTDVALYLTGIGSNFTFKAQKLRMVPDTFTNYDVDVDTRYNTLTRWMPSGTDLTEGIGDSFGGTIFFPTKVRGKGTLYAVKFNSGHNSTLVNTNSFTVSFLHSDDTTVTTVQLLSNTSNSNIIIEQDGSPVVDAAHAPLAEETDYVLVVEYDEDRLQGSLYYINGAIGQGDLVFTTSWGVPSTSLDRGHIGLDFDPYYYDFALRYAGPQAMSYGRYESKSLVSLKPISGVKLFTRCSGTEQLNKNMGLVSYGDATVDTDVNEVTTVVRSGVDWAGGTKMESGMYLGNTHFVNIRGSIFPVTNSTGSAYQVIVQAEGGDPGGAINVLPLIGIKPLQWNEFSVNVGASVLPEKFNVLVRQAGFFDDTFKLRNFSIDHDTVAWYGTSNAGTVWQPFLGAINSQWSALNLRENDHNLRIRAVAITDQGWIRGFNAYPIYGYSGRYVGSKFSRDVRVTGSEAHPAQLPLLFSW